MSRDDWGPALEHLAERKAAARAMGGADKLTRHRSAGKLDARGRIDTLLDDGSFTEVGALIGGGLLGPGKI